MNSLEKLDILFEKFNVKKCNSANCDNCKCYRETCEMVNRMYRFEEDMEKEMRSKVKFGVDFVDADKYNNMLKSHFRQIKVINLMAEAIHKDKDVCEEIDLNNCDYSCKRCITEYFFRKAEEDSNEQNS